MNAPTQTDISELSRQVIVDKLNVAQFEKSESELSEKDWHNRRIELVDKLNESIEAFDDLTYKVFRRNLCVSTQKMVNAYRKKAGLAKFEVTAVL